MFEALENPGPKTALSFVFAALIGLAYYYTHGLLVANGMMLPGPATGVATLLGVFMLAAVMMPGFGILLWFLTGAAALLFARSVHVAAGEAPIALEDFVAAALFLSPLLVPSLLKLMSGGYRSRRF